jgi:hypothetical protein
MVAADIDLPDLRELGWQPLQNRTKGKKAVATEAHLSALAAITPDELVRRVPEADIANGFLNRFLIVATSRSKLLADPPAIRGDLEAEYLDASKRPSGSRGRRDRSAATRPRTNAGSPHTATSYRSTGTGSPARSAHARKRTQSVCSFFTRCSTARR